MEEWSNNACMGYAIAAALSVGMTHQQIEKLIRAMRSIMDSELSVDDAKEVYNKTPF